MVKIQHNRMFIILLKYATMIFKRVQYGILFSITYERRLKHFRPNQGRATFQSNLNTCPIDSTNKIERAKFEVNLAVFLFLRAFKNECLPTLVKNAGIGVSRCTMD